MSQAQAATTVHTNGASPPLTRSSTPLSAMDDSDTESPAHHLPAAVNQRSSSSQSQVQPVQNLQPDAFVAVVSEVSSNGRTPTPDGGPNSAQEAAVNSPPPSPPTSFHNSRMEEVSSHVVTPNIPGSLPMPYPERQRHSVQLNSPPGDLAPPTENLSMESQNDRRGDPSDEEPIPQKQAARAEDDGGGNTTPYAHSALTRNHSVLSVIQEQSDTDEASPRYEKRRTLSPEPQSELVPRGSPSSYLPVSVNGLDESRHSVVPMPNDLSKLTQPTGHADRQSRIDRVVAPTSVLSLSYVPPPTSSFSSSRLPPRGPTRNSPNYQTPQVRSLSLSSDAFSVESSESPNDDPQPQSQRPSEPPVKSALKRESNNLQGEQGRAGASHRSVNFVNSSTSDRPSTTLSVNSNTNVPFLGPISPPSPPPMIPGSGYYPIFSPPASFLPNHLRRGERSHPSTYSPSMLQEVWSTNNSPAYYGSDLVPATPGPISFIPPRGFIPPGLPRAPPVEQTPSNALTKVEQSNELGQEGIIPVTEYAHLFDAKLRLLPGYARQSLFTSHHHNYGEFPGSVRWILENSSRPHDINNALSSLLRHSDEGVIRRDLWLRELKDSPDLLGDFFRACDLVTPVTSVLHSDSPCARILDMLLQSTGIDDGWIIRNVCSTSRSCSTGLRYLICRARSLNMDLSHGSHNRVINMSPSVAFGVAEMSGAVSLDMIPAIRLIEAILPEIRTINDLQSSNLRRFVNVAIRILKRDDHIQQDEPPEVDPARRIASLHLISSILRTYKSFITRLEVESDNPTMPEEEWILQDLAKGDIIQYLHDETAQPLVRCMALRVLRDFADVAQEEVPSWENLKEVIQTSVDALLWQKSWQHGQEETARSLGIAGFSAHDDAYRIIAASPPDLVMSALTKALSTFERSSLVEPLISLIVDHSKLKDKYWPLIISILLHSGCLSVFHQILRDPLPLENDVRYRRLCRAKTDSCIGLTRCFEQMRAKDVKTIPFDIEATLIRLYNDEKLPVSMRGRAWDTLGALKDNIFPSLELSRAILQSSENNVSTFKPALTQSSKTQDEPQPSSQVGASETLIIRKPRNSTSLRPSAANDAGLSSQQSPMPGAREPEESNNEAPRAGSQATSAV